MLGLSHTLVRPHGSIYPPPVLITHTCDTHAHLAWVILTPRFTHSCHGSACASCTQAALYPGSTCKPTHTDTHTHSFIQLLWACALGTTCTHIFEHTSRLLHTQTNRQWPGGGKLRWSELSEMSCPSSSDMHWAPAMCQVPCTSGPYLFQSSQQSHEVGAIISPIL